MTFQAELRGAGDKSAEMAKETLADVEKSFARYSLASDLDVPENPDISAERFELIWEWAEKNSGTSELARTMAIGAGIRLSTCRRGAVICASWRSIAARLVSWP